MPRYVKFVRADPAVSAKPRYSRGQLIGIACCLVIGLAVLGLVVSMGNKSGSTGGSTSSGYWIGLESQLYGHVQNYTNAQAAGNAQGMLNAKTSIVGDCRQASGWGHGGSPDEIAVRDHCQQFGFPIP